jgi:plastocyanin
MKNSLHFSGRSLIFAMLLLISANSCTKDDNNNPYSSNGNNSYGNTGNPNEVIMQRMAFTPSSLTVAVGTKVTWRNNDSMAHTVTSDNALFDSGNIGAGGSYTYTFSTAGTYGYHCTIHSGMTGTVVVK